MRLSRFHPLALLLPFVVTGCGGRSDLLVEEAPQGIGASAKEAGIDSPADPGANDAPLERAEASAATDATADNEAGQAEGGQDDVVTREDAAVDASSPVDGSSPVDAARDAPLDTSDGASPSPCQACVSITCAAELTTCQRSTGCTRILQCAEQNGCVGAACLAPCGRVIRRNLRGLPAASALGACAQTRCGC
jgi:hypothetical protein